MWYKFNEENSIGIPRVNGYQVCFYNMFMNGDCFDECFYGLEDVNKVMPYVETIEDDTNTIRHRVFVLMDDEDVYELKLEKLNNKQWDACNNFYGGR